MIVRDTKNYFALLFAIRGSILLMVLPKIIAFFLFSVVIELLYWSGVSIPSLPLGPMAGIGIALSLFLGFRNNAAYDRWWEGRKLWGTVVGDIRASVREINGFLFDKNARESVLLSLHDFVGGLAAPSSDGADEALERAAATLSSQFQQGAIGDIAQMTLLKRLSRFADLQAGIERLKNTPLPFVYSLLIHRTVFVYCAIFPFAVFSEAGWFSPVLTAMTAYVFLGLAAVTDCLENPFSDNEHAVPVKALETVCKRKLEAALGQPNLTPTVEVENYVLR